MILRRGQDPRRKEKNMTKTKYTYLYNGKVVRNSNRVYEYGLVNHNGEVIACSSTEKGALKLKISEINRHKHNLEYYKKHKPQYAEYSEIDLANTEKWHTAKLERKEN